jgi:hypothetical protein
MLPIQIYKICPYPLHMVKYLGKQHESKRISLNIFVKRLSSITKKGEIESPSLVLANWWNLGTNLYHECYVSKIGICQVMEHGDEVHGGKDGHVMMVIKL